MIRIALAQYAPSDDEAQNLEFARHWLEQAMDRKADLLVLPEHFHGFDITQDQASPLQKNSVLLESLQEWSIEFGIWILAGSAPIGGKPTSLLWDIDGDLVISHAHTPKGKIKLAPTPWGWLGVGYTPHDLHRPEAFQATATKRPIAWVFTGTQTSAQEKTRWDVLTRARALDTGTPVLALNLCAPENIAQSAGKTPWGHSRIVLPDGRMISERPQGPGILFADIESDAG
jgi:predicted amidohydrolase